MIRLIISVAFAYGYWRRLSLQRSREMPMTITPEPPLPPAPPKRDWPNPDSPDDIKEPVEHEHENEPIRDPAKRDEHPN